MAKALRPRRVIALLSAALGLGGLAAVIAGLAVAALRIDAPESLDHLVLGGMIAGGGVLGLAAWAFFRLDAGLARPLAAMSHRLELAATEAAPNDRELSPPPDPGLAAQLGAAVEEAVAALQAARHERDRTTAEATQKLDAQRRRLEAVIRDLQEGVIVCSADERILLYNHRATTLLDGSEALGLGRPIGRLLTPEPLRHALQRLVARRRKGERYPTTMAVCGACDGRRTLQCRVSLLPETGDTPEGCILCLSDVTAEIAENAERDRLLRESLETVRRITSGLHATLEMLVSDPAMPEDVRREFQSAAAGDAARLAEAAATFAERSEGIAAGHWPLAEISSDDIAESAVPIIRSEAGIDATTEGAPVTIRSDGSSLVQLLTALARHVAEVAGAERLTIRAGEGGPCDRAYLDLCWAGDVPDVSALEALIEQPFAEGSALTGREVLDRHGGEAWPDRVDSGLARIRLALRRAEPIDEAAVGDRPEFYDFDIAASPEVLADERRLETLSYVVFDTETTGLDPAGGDRLVQIAGLRIVNGRLLRGEMFDSLVRPGRPIPPQATAVHGIDDAMAAKAPPLEKVLAQFHDFAADTVLVAHNAAFDMAFLRRDEAAVGVVFDMPVLDTVLLSAFLEPDSADLTLDGLAERYGLGFQMGTRHTALGDARVTAELFLKMLPLLARRGVHTLGEASRVSEQAADIRRQQQRYAS